MVLWLTAEQGSRWKYCPPGDMWQCPETSSVVTAGEGVLLASHESRAGSLLAILQYTRHPPQQRINLSEVKTPCCQVLGQ